MLALPALSMLTILPATVATLKLEDVHTTPAALGSV
jgi:hypothetical protein